MSHDATAAPGHLAALTRTVQPPSRAVLRELHHSQRHSGVCTGSSSNVVANNQGVHLGHRERRAQRRRSSHDSARWLPAFKCPTSASRSRMWPALAAYCIRSKCLHTRRYALLSNSESWRRLTPMRFFLAVPARLFAYDVGTKIRFVILALGFTACQPNPQEHEPGSDGTLTAVLEGKTWETTNITALRDDHSFELLASDDQIFLDITVLTNGIGVYTVEDDAVQVYLDINSDIWTSCSGGAGNVSITQYGIDGVAGTFDITIAQGTLRRSIRAGTFNVHFN